QRTVERDRPVEGVEQKRGGDFVRIDLTAYLLRDPARGRPALDPSRAVAPDGGAASVPLRPDLPFEAHLSVVPSNSGRPEWQSFLEQGSAGPLDLDQRAANGAVLLVRVPRDEGDRWVAFTFGLGRYLLERDSLERGFGLRVCLNLAYPRGESLEGPTLP